MVCCCGDGETGRVRGVGELLLAVEFETAWIFLKSSFNSVTSASNVGLCLESYCQHFNMMLYTAF